MIPRRNRRRHERVASSTLVLVTWKDGTGRDRFANARSLDVSGQGIRLETPEPIAERTYVRLRADELGLHGTATVRNCVRKGMRYRVGLEFSGGMKWEQRSVCEEAGTAETEAALNTH